MIEAGGVFVIAADGSGSVNVLGDGVSHVPGIEEGSHGAIRLAEEALQVAAVCVVLREADDVAAAVNALGIGAVGVSAKFEDLLELNGRLGFLGGGTCSRKERKGCEKGSEREACFHSNCVGIILGRGLRRVKLVQDRLPWPGEGSVVIGSSPAFSP